MPSERAMKLSQEILDRIAEALDAERLAGMEAAAEVCEKRKKLAEEDASRINQISIAALGCDWCSGAIRAAIAKEKDKGPDNSTYPCAKCSALRTKEQGGTTFNICDKCWSESHI